MAQPNAKQPDPSVSATDTPDTQRPGYVFVQNLTSGFRELRYEGKTPGGASARRVTTPGLNVVDLAIWAEVAAEGTLVDQLEAFGLIEVDPTKLRNQEAVDLAKRSTARDALKRWQTIEKRQPVLDAIAERLARAAKRGAAA